MHFLSGRISDRIRNNELPADVQVTGRRTPADDRPNPDSIRHGAGYGLGGGATRARAGEGAETHDV